jgi:O-antigen/teichoic acid export membrane protein
MGLGRSRAEAASSLAHGVIRRFRLKLWKAFLRALGKLSGGRELSALLDQALVSGTNFATNVLLARRLGLREYGVFALAWVAVLFVNSLQWAFIISPMMTVGPKQDPVDRPAYYGAVLTQEALFAIFCSMVVVIGVIVGGARFPGWNSSGLAIPLGFAALCYLLQEFIRRYLFSTRNNRLALACDAVSYITQLPILIVMSSYGYLSVRSALWIIGATSLAGFATGCYWLEPIKVRANMLKRVFLRHWEISRWLAPSAIMQWSSGYLFVVAAPIYYGAEAAGVLRAAQNIVGVAHVWFLGLENVVPSEAARYMHKDGVDACVKYIQRIIWRWGAITLVFLVSVATFPGLWLRLVYGAKYQGYGHVLQLYAAVYLLVFFSGPLRAGLQALEYTAPVFWSYSAMTIFSVIFAGPFATHLGLTGVMIGIIATQLIFQGIVGLAFMIRVRQMRESLSLAHQMGSLPFETRLRTSEDPR